MNARVELTPTDLAQAAIPDHVFVSHVTSIPQWLALRKPDVTASSAGVLYGDGVVDVGAYGTALQLYCLKKGLIEPEAPTHAMAFGNLIEPVIMKMLQIEHPTWKFEPANRYYSDPLARIGATPDFFVTRPDRPGFGTINAKSIGHYAKHKWRDENGDAQIPLWIVIQLNIEAALCGASWAAVAPFLKGESWIEPVEEVELRPALMVDLAERVADFWLRVKEGRPYEPNWNKDAGLVARLFDGEGGDILDLGDDAEVLELLNQRDALKPRESDGAAATKDRKLIDAKLIHRLGNASGGRVRDGRTFTVKIVKKKSYEVKASQYPQLTVRVA